MQELITKLSDYFIPKFGINNSFKCFKVGNSYIHIIVSEENEFEISITLECYLKQFDSTLYISTSVFEKDADIDFLVNHIYDELRAFAREIDKINDSNKKEFSNFKF